MGSDLSFWNRTPWKLFLLIEKGCSCFHPYWSLIGDIHLLLHRSWQVRVQHVLREGNQCADHLAKLGSRQVDSVMEWDSPPPGLGLHLQADAIGLFF